MKAAMKFQSLALLAWLVASNAETTVTSGEDVEDEYDHINHVASLLEGTCQYNTYMCCWTERETEDGEAVEDNTDVCRYVDAEHKGIDYPAESEGDVHCHGFAWPKDADYLSYIMPLYIFVRNLDHREYRGYFGNVEGAPECGCIEEMPVVSRSDCTMHGSNGLQACPDNDLLKMYKFRLDKPMGELDFNLVGECSNKDAPVDETEEEETTGSATTSSATNSSASPMSEGGEVEEFMPETPEYEEDEAMASLLNDACKYNTFMCCWPMNDGDGMEDNTDVCYSGGSDGDYDFPGDSEGETHCHGFAWADGADLLTHILPLYSFVHQFDHRNNRGYYGHIEGAPECGCIEEMPVVTRSDCTTINRNGLQACANNDLKTQYKFRLDEPKGALDFNLVGDCDNANAPQFIEYEYEIEREVDDTYDEDVAVSEVLAGCRYKSYMCCWTEKEGGIEGNADVCRVSGYPMEGDIVEYPGDSEGATYCHGFGWARGDDFLTVQMPLYHYVTNLEDGAYGGNVEHAPECGCVEDMPIISDAACTTYGMDGLEPCRDNSLFKHHRGRLDAPGGSIDGHLVTTCDNAEEE